MIDNDSAKQIAAMMNDAYKQRQKIRAVAESLREFANELEEDTAPIEPARLMRTELNSILKVAETASCTSKHIISVMRHYADELCEPQPPTTDGEIQNLALKLADIGEIPPTDETEIGS